MLYGYALFATYDEMARDFFASSRVKFLNISRATSERKVVDPASSGDGLHWCNWASTSVPQMIVNKILHMLSHTSPVQ
jgi:hypothetical protein